MTSLIVLQNCRTIQLNKGKATLIDEADWHLVGRNRWQAVPASHGRPTFYVRRSIQRDGIRFSEALHRLICEGSMVDHRDGDGLNNTRENLRPCTQAENNRNRRRSRGSSRFKGVYWDKRRKKWTAALSIDKKILHIGYYTNERDAALAYDNAARRYHGEFACTNSMIFGDL